MMFYIQTESIVDHVNYISIICVTCVVFVMKKNTINIQLLVVFILYYYFILHLRSVHIYSIVLFNKVTQYPICFFVLGCR